MRNVGWIGCTAITWALVLAAAANAQITPGLTDKIDAAEKKLDADIKACRPIDLRDYQALFDHALQNVESLKTVGKTGAPISIENVGPDRRRAEALLDRAREAVANPCKPPAKTTPPTTVGPVKAPLFPQAGTVNLDPWSELKGDAFDLFEALEEAIWDCDADAVQKLIPELESLKKRARDVAATAKAAGKFSKVNADEAAKLADSIEDAIDAAKSFDFCPEKDEPKSDAGKPTSTGKGKQPSGAGQSKPSTLNDLFKAQPEKPPPATGPKILIEPSKMEPMGTEGGANAPQFPANPEKPTPPKHSIVDDLVETPSPGEVQLLLKLLDELNRTTADYPNLLEGCQPQIWDKHIAHLEAVSKRARQIADWANTPGQTTGVDPAEARRLADKAQAALDAAKRGKGANQAQWRGAYCPGPATPPPEESRTAQVEPPITPAGELGGIYGSMMGVGMVLQSGAYCDPAKWREIVAFLDAQVARAEEIAAAARAAGRLSTITPEKAQHEAEQIRLTAEALKRNGPHACPMFGQAPSDPIAAESLSTHNAIRAEYGAPPLQWDLTLAQHARDYAEQLAKEGQLVHAPREGRGIERENISQGLRGWTVRQHLGSWIKERKNFKPGIFPDVSLTGYWYDVGHLTQMIWLETFKVGCGMAVGGASSWFVCRYSPGGNKDGKAVGLATGQAGDAWKQNVDGRSHAVPSVYDSQSNEKEPGFRPRSQPVPAAGTFSNVGEAGGLPNGQTLPQVPNKDSAVPEPKLPSASPFQTLDQQFSARVDAFSDAQARYEVAARNGDIAGIRAARGGMDAALAQLDVLTTKDSVLNSGDSGMRAAIVLSLHAERQAIYGPPKVSVAGKPVPGTGYFANAIKLTKSQKKYFDASKTCDSAGVQQAKNEMTAALSGAESDATMAIIQEQAEALLKHGLENCGKADSKVPAPIIKEGEVFKPREATDKDLNDNPP